LNLEIAQAMSQRGQAPQPAFQPGRKCVGTSDDVIKGFYVIRGIVSSPFLFPI